MSAVGSAQLIVPLASHPFTGRDVVRAALLGLRWGAGILVAALAVAVLVLPAVTGSTALTVLTGSMRPTLPPGTLVVVRPVETDAVRIGDVITFQVQPGRPEVVTHRVVAVQSLADGSRAFVTRGDANPGPDPAPVLPAQVKGKLWYSLPLIGSVALLLGGQRTLLLTLAGAALLAYAAAVVVSALLRSRRGQAARRQHDRRGRHSSSVGARSAESGFRASGEGRPRP